MAETEIKVLIEMLDARSKSAYHLLNNIQIEADKAVTVDEYNRVLDKSTGPVFAAALRAALRRQAGLPAAPETDRVTFEIEKIDDTVKLNVIHVDLEGEMAGKVSKGWPLVLSSMKTFLETNKALNTWGLKQPSCSNS